MFGVVGGIIANLYNMVREGLTEINISAQTWMMKTAIQSSWLKKVIKERGQ